MERSTVKDRSSSADTGIQNEHLAQSVIQSALDVGIEEFFICPGGRNAPFVALFSEQKNLSIYNGFEERATAFFALGNSKRKGRPVAVITTSGTATGELLPAVMEADYSGIPVLVITADRPRRYRGSGAPQTCDQVGIYSHYVSYSQDIEFGEKPDLSRWDHRSPVHLNICFDEPLLPKKSTTKPLKIQGKHSVPKRKQSIDKAKEALDSFLQTSRHPLIIVNSLDSDAREPVINFLSELNAPVILENISNLREDPSLQRLWITRRAKLLESAKECSYKIDGVLRIGGVPTLRFWRDLEDMEETMPVLNISSQRFSGLSWADVHCLNIGDLFSTYTPKRAVTGHERWFESDMIYAERLDEIISEEPRSEQSLIRAFSKHIPRRSFVYLGNSLPIREWDLAATHEYRECSFSATRGLNGIDGQIATFLGMCSSGVDNWAVIGDLTALYDLSAPWFLKQIPDVTTNIVIINNGGGKIFERMFSHPLFLNGHDLSFEPFAKIWNLGYEKWEVIPETMNTSRSRIIELRPDSAETHRFWEKLKKL